MCRPFSARKRGLGTPPRKSRTKSIQKDALGCSGEKALARRGWYPPDHYSFAKVVIDQTRWLMMRVGRNLGKLRLYFWPIDNSVWLGAIGIAASNFLEVRTRVRRGKFPRSIAIYSTLYTELLRFASEKPVRARLRLCIVTDQYRSIPPLN
jgi:hypothetical protein